MTTTKSRLPWTHYYQVTSKHIVGFTLDVCENCGNPIQAANSVKLDESPDRLDALGLVCSDFLPPEGYYSDETGGEACYGCNA